MKRFIIGLIIICLAGSLILWRVFRYSPVQIGYHLITLTFLIGAIAGINLLLGRINAKRWQRFFIHTASFLFFTALVLFYLVIIGSNAFWGKPLTASLFISYTASFDSFISSLPVEKWLFYTALVLLLVIIIAVYYIIRPRPFKLYTRSTQLGSRLSAIRYKPVLTIAAIVILILLFRPLLLLKRTMHFRGEPVLEFTLGQMWESGHSEFVFDNERLKKGLSDKPCIDSIAPEPGKLQNRVVVVILADGLRSDYLPAYGHRRPTTPFLDSLRQSGQLAVVKNAFSTSTTTLVGMGGLLGSKDWDNFSFVGLNLMKFLKLKGYSTYAFLTGQHRSWYGLTSIYRNDCDFFYESTTKPTVQNFDDLTTLREFQRTRIRDNSFVYIHLLSTHAIGQKHDAFRRYTPDKIGIGTNNREVLINNYDNGILQADYVIREVFAKLQKDGQLSRSTIYFLSDHGELFGEDGRWSHSGSIQQNLLTIPLMVYDQEPGWYTNTEAATIKDVAPSIADRLGYAVPGCWEGISLHQPVHNFTMRVNSGIPCPFPEGVLTRKDSLYELQILNEQKKVSKVLTTRGGQSGWESHDVKQAINP